MPERQVLPEGLCPDRKQAHLDLDALSRKLPLHPLGVHSLGKDGILRSLTDSRKVLDAVPLTPRLIKAYLDQMEYDKELEADFRGVDGTKELEADFRGVDGTKVPKEHWLHPAKSLLPVPLEGQVLEEARKFMAANGVGFDVVVLGEDDENGSQQMCPIEVVADYKVL